MNRRVGTTLGAPLSRAPKRFRQKPKGPFLRKPRVAPSNHNLTQARLNHPTQAYHHLRQQMDLNPGVEHSLFSQSAEKFSIQTGTKQNAPTQINGALALAHNHTGSCEWSEDDIQILLAHAILNEGEEVEHTILGKDNGVESYLRAVFSVVNGELSVSFVDGSSDELEKDLHQSLERVFSHIKGLSHNDLLCLSNKDLSEKQAKNYLPQNWRTTREGMPLGEFSEKLCSDELEYMIRRSARVKGLKIGSSVDLTLRGKYQAERVKYLALNSGFVEGSDRSFNFHIRVHKVGRGQIRIELIDTTGDCLEVMSPLIFKADHIDTSHMNAKSLEGHFQNECNLRFLKAIDPNTKYSNRGYCVSESDSDFIIDQFTQTHWVDAIKTSAMTRGMQVNTRRTLTIRGRLIDQKIHGLSLSLGQNTRDEYFNLIIELIKDESGDVLVEVQEVSGLPHAVAELGQALKKNKGVHVDHLEPSLFEHENQTQSPNFLPDNWLPSNRSLTVGEFIQRIKSGALTKAIVNCNPVQNLEAMHTVRLTLRGTIIKDDVVRLILTTEEEHLDPRNQFYIDFEIMSFGDGENSVWLLGIEGSSHLCLLPALFDQDSISLRTELLQKTRSVFINDITVRSIDADSEYKEAGLVLSHNNQDRFYHEIAQTNWLQAIERSLVIESLQPGESLDMLFKANCTSDVTGVEMLLGWNHDFCDDFFLLKLRVTKNLDGSIGFCVMDFRDAQHARTAIAFLKNPRLDWSQCDDRSYQSLIQAELHQILAKVIDPDYKGGREKSLKMDFTDFQILLRNRQWLQALESSLALKKITGDLNLPLTLSGQIIGQGVKTITLNVGHNQRKGDYFNLQFYMNRTADGEFSFSFCNIVGQFFEKLMPDVLKNEAFLFENMIGENPERYVQALQALINKNFIFNLAGSVNYKKGKYVTDPIQMSVFYQKLSEMPWDFLIDIADEHILLFGRKEFNLTLKFQVEKGRAASIGLVAQAPLDSKYVCVGLRVYRDQKGRVKLALCDLNTRSSRVMEMVMAFYPQLQIEISPTLLAEPQFGLDSVERFLSGRRAL